MVVASSHILATSFKTMVMGLFLINKLNVQSFEKLEECN